MARRPPLAVPRDGAGGEPVRPDRWTKIEHLLQAALEHTGADRSAFLARACDGDTDLRDQVEALLDADQRAQGFLEASALEDAADLFIDGHSEPVAGSRIAHYVVEQRLGSGGNGEVYLARDIRLGRRIALKLLDDAIADDGASRARFLREARLASAISHPHVCARIRSRRGRRPPLHRDAVRGGRDAAPSHRWTPARIR